MKLRLGRHQGRNVYLQLDENADNSDIFLARFDHEEAALALTYLVNQDPIAVAAIARAAGVGA